MTVLNNSKFACFNRESLEAILPHRGYALRKIDGVFYDKNNPGLIIGLKHIKAEDPDVEGHFPGSPTYPGYAQDEFVCLTAAALISYSMDGLGGNPYVVQKIAKYKRSVMPGDELKAEVKLISKRSRFFLFSAEIKNQNREIVAEYEKIVGAV